MRSKRPTRRDRPKRRQQPRRARKPPKRKPLRRPTNHGGRTAEEQAPEPDEAAEVAADHHRDVEDAADTEPTAASCSAAAAPVPAPVPAPAVPDSEPAKAEAEETDLKAEAKEMMSCQRERPAP